MNQGKHSLRQRLQEKAEELGFCAFGVARADAAPKAAARLKEWLVSGAHGEMLWMEETAERRASPAGLWPEVRSVIALGMSYAPAVDPLALAEQPAIGRISVYAQGADYHDLVKKALKALARWLVEEAGCELKVFVDTAPVMEKPLAEAAGLGWQGKHTNLVSRRDGSWLFLGAIYTTLDLEPSPAPHPVHCGSCSACLSACPTNAFPAPFRLDARRCISYLTIEHKGPIPEEFREAIGNRIYGCDDCLAVCPWNRFAEAARANKAFLPRAELAAPGPRRPPRPRRCRLPTRCSRARRSSGSAATAWSAMPPSPPAIAGTRSWCRCWSGCFRMKTRWWRKPPNGRWTDSAPRRRPGPRTAVEPDPGFRRGSPVAMSHQGARAFVRAATQLARSKSRPSGSRAST